MCYYEQNLSFFTLYGVWDYDFQNFKFLNFILLRLVFYVIFCSIDFKRQSEHSGFRPDTSTLVVPTFDENGIFMLGVVFFIQSTFADRNSNFQQNFFIPHWKYQLLDFKCKKIFHLQIIFVKFWGFENLPYSRIKFARFEEFINKTESVRRII